MPEFESFPVLETGRLILREITRDDASAVFRFRSDPEVQRYNGGPMAEMQEATDLIDQLADGYRNGTMVEWGVTLKGVDGAVKEGGGAAKESDGDVIGIFGYANWAHVTRQAEIGYCLARPFWRQGIAAEAMREIIAFGFRRMDLNRIHACPWAENAASCRLLEKLGFQREGVRRDEYWVDGAFHDEALYSLLRREYDERL